MDQTIPPLLGAAVRFLVAGAAMLAFLCARRRALPRLRCRELAAAALVGVLLAAGGNGIVSYAELHVPAGLAALMVASVPLWLLLIRLLTPGGAIIVLAVALVIRAAPAPAAGET